MVGWSVGRLIWWVGRERWEVSGAGVGGWAGWLEELVDFIIGRDGWLVGWVVGWLVGWLVGRLVGWLNIPSVSGGAGQQVNNNKRRRDNTLRRSSYVETNSCI